MTAPGSLAVLLGELEAVAPGDARTASLRMVSASLARHNDTLARATPETSAAKLPPS
jgi:hypothetical protein